MPIKVTDYLAPTSSLDTFPTHKAEYGLGGHRTVATIADRDNLPADRREEGMTVYVQSDGLTYTLKPDLGTWSTPGTSGNIEYERLHQLFNITDVAGDTDKNSLSPNLNDIVYIEDNEAYEYWDGDSWLPKTDWTINTGSDGTVPIFNPYEFDTYANQTVYDTTFKIDDKAIEVIYNGIVLPPSDYVIGVTDITIDGLADNGSLVVKVYESVSVANTYTQAEIQNYVDNIINDIQER